MTLPLLDLSELIYDPDFAQPIRVNRRSAVVGNNGRPTVLASWDDAYAIVDPSGGRKRRISPDAAIADGTIVLYTQYPFSQVQPGLLADQVQWAGSMYVVLAVTDFARFGAGWKSVTAILQNLVESYYSQQLPGPV